MFSGCKDIKHFKKVFSAVDIEYYRKYFPGVWTLNFKALARVYVGTLNISENIFHVCGDMKQVKKVFSGVDIEYF